MWPLPVRDRGRASNPLSRTIGGDSGEKMLKHSVGPDKSSGEGGGGSRGVEGRVDAKCRKGKPRSRHRAPRCLPLSALLSKVTFLPPPVIPSIIRVTPPLPSRAASIVRSFDFFLVRKWLSSHLRKTSGRLEPEMEFPEKGGRPGATGVVPRVEVSPGYKIAVREKLIINLIKPARCTCNRIGWNTVTSCGRIMARLVVSRAIYAYYRNVGALRTTDRVYVRSVIPLRRCDVINWTISSVEDSFAGQIASRKSSVELNARPRSTKM